MWEAHGNRGVSGSCAVRRGGTGNGALQWCTPGGTELREQLREQV